ncbi:CBS domain-containing protein [Thermocatellispora tengchongensis]|uniref:CBS domain-containing protein n=1 Tax=Thermocatellispora tengchongensis TaxID=1073253 RepID=A0A840PAQ7_9ACTN|nr:CBS domain-containing protein [Thermocatellispora tengchongensis]MBB5135766.1 CBS domain-containing protein [Thermocatellispora tengchongensis]
MRVKVSDVMTKDVVSVREDTPFKDIAELLIKHGIGAVPVVDAAGRVAGVVSEADLLRKEEFREQYYREGYQPPLRARLRHRLTREGAHPEDKARGDTAAEIMTTPPVTVRASDSIVSAMRRMDEHGVKRLPVVADDGTLRGMLSRRDLLKVFVRPDAEIAAEVREDILDHALWVDTSGVRIEVDHGVVTLSGTMRKRGDAELTVRMAARINGVVDVIDRITWQEDDTPVWKGR